jgi:anti-sigma factor RsiW
MRHVPEADLTLYATGDLSLWLRPLVRLHISRCPNCRRRAEAYRADQKAIRQLAREMPEGVHWDRLAAEMAANIRVGLAAGECVTPRPQKRTLSTGWRVAGAMAGFSVLLVSAWWLNMPAAQTASLGRAMKKIVQVRPWQTGNLLALEDAGPLVEVSPSGIQLQENGGTLGVSQGRSRPVSVTLSVQGSARARYIDSDTGQVTITSVYAQ